MLQNNWRWAKLGEISDVIMGQSPSGDETTDNPAYIPLIGGAADMGELLPMVTRYTKVPTKLSQAGDVIICVRATLGRPIYSDSKYCLGRGVAAIRSDILTKEFIRYYLLRNEQYLYDNAAGSTFLQITSTKLKDMPIPVPPLEEQERVVNLIESLFGKLDRAKVLSQSIVDNYESRRSAILHKAFTGRLTNSNLDSWQDCKMGDIFNLQAGKNLDKGKISKVKTKTHCYPCFGGNGIRGFVETYNRVGEYPIIGRQGALCGNINLASGHFYATEHAVVVSYKYDVVTNWAVNYLKFLDLNQYATATAQPGLAVNKILNLTIKYTPYEEQKKIVRILDSLLAKEQRTKELAELTLRQIDLMKKAILMKAFNG